MEPIDIHTKAAAKMFGVSESEVTPDMRLRAKTASYVQLYAPTPGEFAAWMARRKPQPWYRRLWAKLFNKEIY